MDFVDWSSFVLRKLIEMIKGSSEARLFGYDIYSLTKVIFPEDEQTQPEFWASTRGKGLNDALHQLEQIGLIWNGPQPGGIFHIAKNQYYLANDMLPLWESICQIPLQPEQEQLLKTLNRNSERVDKDHAWLEDIYTQKLMADLKWTDSYLFVSVIQELERDGLAHSPGMVSNFATLKGLIWETRRGLTLESRRIDALLKEWETTSVEFKRELYIETADQKAEFVKDILGLANTKASGRRLLIIGFDNSTRQYHAPPDPKLTQEGIEQVLARCTGPMVDVRYNTTDYRSGLIGQIEVLRDPTKLPYRVKEREGSKDTGGKRVIEKDQVFVRHGSLTEAPTPDELQSIMEEGDRARSMP